MIEGFKDFFYKYYVVPGYDWVDTLTYGIILGLAVFYLLPKLKKIGFQIDKDFGFSLIPYIILGATGRELVDQGLGWYSAHSEYPANFYLVSPTIYFTMFLFTLFWLVLSYYVGRKTGVKYTSIFAFAGSIFAGYNVSLIIPNIENPQILLWVSAALGTSLLVAYGIIKAFKFTFVWVEMNYLVIFAHLLDASSTFIGVDYLGHIEQHVLPNVFIGLTGTAAVMYPLKLMILFPALYYIDKDLAGQEFDRKILKIVITILGLGPGIRNITLMLLG